MTRLRLKHLVPATFVLLLMPSPARAESIQATLTGYEEVPAVSSEAGGEFRATISPDGQSIDFELTYAFPPGASVLQAHIHFGQFSVNGGIVVFLCTNLGNDPAGIAPPCPTPSGRVTETRTAAHVIGAAGSGAFAQGIAATELDELVAAIRAGTAYANVHSSQFPGGEIRGQIRASSRR